MPLKILIAEDDEDIMRQYQMALDALGHEVYLTKNGEECIKNYTYALTFNYENRPSGVVRIGHTGTLLFQSVILPIATWE